MVRFGNILVAVAVVVAGCPGVFCTCTLGAAAPGATVKRCPFCSGNSPSSSQSRPAKPCRCGCNQVIAAVSGGPAVAIESAVHTRSVDVLTVLAVVEMPSLGSRPEKGGAAQPPGSTTGAGRVLPIFLGHLRF